MKITGRIAVSPVSLACNEHYLSLHFLSFGIFLASAYKGGQSSPSPSHLLTVSVWSVYSVLITAEFARTNLELNFCPVGIWTLASQSTVQCVNHYWALNNSKDLYKLCTM